MYSQLYFDYNATTPCDPGVLEAAIANREVLNLRFVHDLPLDAIAQGLGISLSAAKMRLYRSLESFRVQYAGLMAACRAAG